MTWRELDDLKKAFAAYPHLRLDLDFTGGEPHINVTAPNHTDDVSLIATIHSHARGIWKVCVPAMGTSVLEGVSCPMIAQFVASLLPTV